MAVMKVVGVPDFESKRLASHFVRFSRSRPGSIPASADSQKVRELSNKFELSCCELNPLCALSAEIAEN
jgi:hypothetical protein